MTTESTEGRYIVAPPEEGDHSLGPWRVIRESGERAVRAQPPGYGPKVATVWHVLYEEGRPAPNDPIADANARLIQAAPDLLAAAEAILASPGGDEPLTALRAAVDRARGRGG